MKTALLVFMGGGLGSVTRFAIGRALNPVSGWPWGTFAANIGACLILGMAVGLAQSRGHMTDLTKWFLLSGFCGGFSTFSTFSGETVQLFQDGKFGVGLLYAMGSLATCLVAVWAGQWLADAIFKA